MSTHLVTGKAGYEHVKASDHGALHAAIMGGGEFVLEGGEQFACQVISNNKVRIFDGEALMQGRHIRIDRNTYEETTHDNGVQGYKRIDLIVLTYTKDEGTGVEDVALEVIKGTPSENNPSVPSYVTGDILNNRELKNQMPLYKIPFDGLSIGEPVKMFTTVPTMQTMKEEVDAKVADKIAEMDDAFAELEAGIEDKIAEAGKPLSSNASDWGMIANYGEYSADAKTVGEEFAKVSDSLGGLSFGYDETTQKYGYWKKEADTEVFVPFRGIFSMPEECFVYTTKGTYGDSYVIMESNYLKICGHSNTVACFGIKIPANTTIGIEWGFDKYSDKATVKFGLQDWSSFTQDDAITQSLYNQMVSSDVNKKTDTYNIPNNTSGFWVLKIICDHTNNNANSPYIKLYGIS